jgi:hypothetical protein
MKYETTTVGTSSRLRKAYVAAKFFRWLDLTARARHSVATAASSSALVRLQRGAPVNPGRAEARPYRPSCP